MDLFLQIQDEKIRANESVSALVDGFPELNAIITTLSEGDGLKIVYPVSANCAFENNGFRCVCNLTLGFVEPTQNLEKERFFLLFDRLTEFVAPLEAEVDTVIEIWLLPTWYDKENNHGWSAGVSVYGYAESETEARSRWAGAVEILHNFLRRKLPLVAGLI